MKERIYENLKSFGIALVLALIIRALIVQSFHIPSGSMEPSLMIGDFILVDKVTYHFRKPDRGDVVVFHFPLNERIYYIKRIIGLPGDRVQLLDGKLYVNGKPCSYQSDGNYTYYESGKKYTGKVLYEFLPRKGGGIKRHKILRIGSTDETTSVITVPKDEYFMMGDNRDESYDSRYWGFVKGNQIVGIARLIFFSWNSHRHLPRFGRILSLVR